MSAIIKVENLSFSYSGDNDALIQVLHDVSFDVQEGSFVAVLGHNGSGKSTLAKLLNMILTREDGNITGRIIVCGRDITEESITEDEMYEIRKRVGMVHQNPDNQIVATTVEEDVAFGPENLGVPQPQLRERVDEALAEVRMSEYAAHAPHRLSGGQKQRVAIAGIIAMQPDVIIFDESTAMLDPMGRDEVMNTIRRLNREKGKTVILITHYMNEAAEADRVIVLNEGRVFLHGTATEVFTQVELLKSVCLDVPQVTEFICKLRKNGIPVNENALHTDEAAEILKKVYGGD